MGERAEDERLTLLEADLSDAVAAGQDPELARRRLVELLHTVTCCPTYRPRNSSSTTAAPRAGAGPLVAALELDHQCLLGLVEHLHQARTGLDAAMAARAVVVLFALRTEKEESVLVPALIEAGVDVSILVEGRPEVLGHQD